MYRNAQWNSPESRRCNLRIQNLPGVYPWTPLLSTPSLTVCKASSYATDTYVLYSTVLSFFVLCFDIYSNKSQTAFGRCLWLYDFNVQPLWDDHLFTVIHKIFGIFCVFCGSEVGHEVCMWRYRASFSVYFENITLARLKTIGLSVSASLRRVL